MTSDSQVAEASIAKPGRLPDGWTAGSLLVAALLTLPIAAVAWIAFGSSGDIWQHLSSTVLPRYVETTVLLMTGVGLGTLTIGAVTAWLVTMCRFPGRRFFEWALVLPLAMPAYVIAYVYTDMLDFAGPVQSTLRAVFGWRDRQDYWFPEIRSLGGAVSMMSLVLFPYVYLLTRAAFLEQSVCALEVSRTLGKSALQTFRHVAMPLARPAVVAGLSLVMMETLNDFGTVDYFAVATFTAGIYDVWLNMGSVAGAAQLALVMLAFVFVLITVERLARKGRRFHHTTTRYQDLPATTLHGPKAWLATAFCAFPVLFGFAVPTGQLLAYALRHYEAAFQSRFAQYAVNSIGLAVLTAAIAVLIGLCLAYAVRLRPNPVLKTATRIAGMGYAVPGAVLAIGVVIPLSWFDNALSGAIGNLFGVSVGLLLSGTVMAMVFGYLSRFSALSLGALDASLGKITPSMDAAARTLGCGPAGVLRRVHLPIMRPSILTAGLLVFVDVMKELPITMLLRPFNFETLATYVHQFASDELLEQSSLGALTIVACGVIPVLLLSRSIAGGRRGTTLGSNARAHSPKSEPF